MDSSEKNAVLIIEFAVQKRRKGESLRVAAIEGARVRFRPILMTSVAFVAGLIPLVIVTGAGAIGNRTIGSSAMGGRLLGTIFGVVIIPGLYYIFGSLADGKKLMDNESDEPWSEEITKSQDRDNQKDSLIEKLKNTVRSLRRQNKNQKKI